MTTTIEKLAEEATTNWYEKEEYDDGDRTIIIEASKEAIKTVVAQAIQSAMLELIGAVPEVVCICNLPCGHNQARKDLITKAQHMGCDTTRLLNPKT
jgi:hypothetical protein